MYMIQACTCTVHGDSLQSLSRISQSVLDGMELGAPDMTHETNLGRVVTNTMQL